MAVEPEQRLAEALRARATGAGAPPPDRYVDRHFADPADEPEPAGMRVRTALLIALGVGLLLGVVLGLVSLLAPGVLPGTS